MSYRSSSDGAWKTWVAIGVCIGVFIVGILLVINWYQTFKVYSAEQDGKAELQKAEFTRQISELDAQAKRAIAKGEADAEVIRATGAAEANKVLANSLEGKADYLRYLQIQAMRDSAVNGDRTIVYVPTDGLLPISLPQPEAGRALPADK